MGGSLRQIQIGDSLVIAKKPCRGASFWALLQGLNCRIGLRVFHPKAFLTSQRYKEKTAFQQMLLEKAIKTCCYIENIYFNYSANSIKL